MGIDLWKSPVHASHTFLGALACPILTGSVFHSGDTALSTPLTTIYVMTFADRCADVL